MFSDLGLMISIFEKMRYIINITLNKFVNFHFSNPLLPEFFFRSFLGHSLRKVLFVYRLIVATLIGIFFVGPFLNKKSKFGLRRIYAPLGSKGLMSRLIHSERTKNI